MQVYIAIKNILTYKFAKLTKKGGNVEVLRMLLQRFEDLR